MARIGKIKMPPHTVATISKMRFIIRFDFLAKLFCTRTTIACSSINPRALILLAGIPKISGTNDTLRTNNCKWLINFTNCFDSNPGAQTSTFCTPVSFMTSSTSINLPKHGSVVAILSDLGLSSTKPIIL